MKRCALLLLPLLLAACGGPGSYAEREDFQSDPRHRRDFPTAAAPLCDAARRVLLGDGYVVLPGRDALTFSGAKEFRVDDKGHAQLRLHLACSEARGGATLFVTATEEHFDVKTTRQSTSVGVPLVAPISFSSSTEGDNQVKTRGETVVARDFYERFYRAVQRELGGRE
ncbi:MAG: DUF2242 domain-containing protein [Betaproteobacteria bacterium]|nr:MAG: DUF2242 domain-containing protein [Betaproteobacteria bacterium]